MNTNTKKYDNRGKTETKPKPKSKLNINPTNYTAADLAASQSKKGKNVAEKKPVNHWGTVEEETTPEQVEIPHPEETSSKQETKSESPTETRKPEPQASEVKVESSQDNSQKSTTNYQDEPRSDQEKDNKDNRYRNNYNDRNYDNRRPYKNNYNNNGYNNSGYNNGGYNNGSYNNGGYNNRGYNKRYDDYEDRDRDYDDGRYRRSYTEKVYCPKSKGDQNAYSAKSGKDDQVIYVPKT